MTEIKKRPTMKRRYRPSFDVLRLICIVLIVFIEFGLNFIPFFSYIQSILYFAPGTLFAIYGFIVLRDSADLRKNIKHTMKVFFVMLAVYGLLTIVNFWLMTGNPLAGFSKRNIFNFVVLNIWSSSIGASIWYVQSTLYALIAFWILRRFKKYDWLLCLVLFVLAAFLGEFAGIIHFNFHGYTYIPGNFLTRTMPYMLLGRLIHYHYRTIKRKMRFKPYAYFWIGLILSVAEFLALFFSGYLVYPNHFIGFIPMTAILCIRCVQHPRGGRLRKLRKFASASYKALYYSFNPLGYILLIAAVFFCQTSQQYVFCQNLMGIFVLVLIFAYIWCVAFLKERLQFKRKKRKRR